MDRPQTLGELRASGYRVRSVKDEMRHNLLHKLRRNEPLFDGILGYEDTVLPEIQNAVLARHDLLLLGLRGQAKTRMLRQLVRLLDDAIPIVAGSEVNDNPFAPLSRFGRDQVAAHGEDTPLEWVGRDQRYHEKLATPDVTIADLLGEIDLIKHAEGRYLSSDATMHFGLIPRSNRGIFCLNELPDLSPKIQVGLFNVLEERDIQIRGYPLRLDLDLCLVFSANPEDYTNRGRIVTPLKDRLGSVIRTHYPPTRDLGIAITDANAWTERDAVEIVVPRFLKEILEEFAHQARKHPAINQQSGVSVRLSIANRETLVSNAERRAVTLGEPLAVPRISDLAFLPASTRGKIELTLAEDDAAEDKIIQGVLADAIKVVFEQTFDTKAFRPLVEWFDAGHTFVTGDQVPSAGYEQRLDELPGVRPALETWLGKEELALGAAGIASGLEFVLEGLHVQNRLNKKLRQGRATYQR